PGSPDTRCEPRVARLLARRASQARPSGTRHGPASGRREQVQSQMHPLREVVVASCGHRTVPPRPPVWNSSKRANGSWLAFRQVLRGAESSRNVHRCAGLARGSSRTLGAMPQAARPRGRQVTVFQAVALFLSSLLVAGVGGVVAAGLVVPAVAGTKALTNTVEEILDDLPSELA